MTESEPAAPAPEPPVHHTWLFEEGHWEATGTFVDGEGNRIPLTGAADISHTDEGWINASWMKVHPEGAESFRFENRYTVQPFEPGALKTEWVSVNPDLGELRGRVTVVGDSLLFEYASEDREHSGTEYLRRLDDDRYENRGVFYSGGRRVSSWIVRLTRTR